MKLKNIILALVFLCIGASLIAQDKNSTSISKRQNQEQIYLAQAKDLKATNPQKAIKFLERAIKASKKSGNYLVNAEAYFILGNIYEDIDQEDLALERYIKAERFFELTNETELKAQNYYRLASLQLTLNQVDNSKINFQKCRETSINSDLQTLCYEGLAGVSFKEENYNEGYAILDKVQQESPLDSITISRVEAQRADGYIQQNDYSNARNAYDNSINNLPQSKNKERSKNFKTIEKTKERLLDMNADNEAEQIAIRESNVAVIEKLKLPKANLIADNLKLADIYIKNKKFEEAEKLIKISESNIDKSTSQKQIAEVFKKSSELNNLKGNLQLALADYEKFTIANDRLLEEKQKELEMQVAVVKEQQNIDLLEKDFILEEKEKTLLQSQLQTQKIIIGLLSLLLIGAVVFFYFLWRNVKARRKANQLLLLKSLRTQMNPHFIFNALNSVNNFIAKNDEKAANKFLSNFSRLMRKVLDYSQKDFISFVEEIELNELYLKLEHFRFRDKFEYEFNKDIDINLSDLEIPPMLIQPFIENAVWHGLRYKEDKGLLQVDITQQSDNLLISIKDNGIGRAKSKELKTLNQRNYKSTGLANVERRVELINEIYEKNYRVEIRDWDKNASDVGTQVSIFIPLESIAK